MAVPHKRVFVKTSQSIFEQPSTSEKVSQSSGNGRENSTNLENMQSQLKLAVVHCVSIAVENSNGKEQFVINIALSTGEDNKG